MSCRVCDARPAVAKGRCSTCYRYLCRTGRDRSSDLVRRLMAKRAEMLGVVALLRGASAS